MPYIKDSFSVLAECAAIDLPGTDGIVRESEVRSDYSSIEEVSEEYIATAEMVPVVKINEEYFTEATFLAPFMRDNGVKSIAEALDAVASANNLPAKSVGLLIESECGVSEMIGKACEKENAKVKDKVLDKVSKATRLAKSLKDKGYPCKKKKGTKCKTPKFEED